MIFFEPKRIYNGPFDGDHNKAASPWNTHPLGEVPEEHYKIETLITGDIDESYLKYIDNLRNDASKQSIEKSDAVIELHNN